MAVTLAFDLPGDWTSSRIFVRLLMVVQSPWMPDEVGFANAETGERARILMGRPAPELAASIAQGVCPIRPTVDDSLLEAVAAHRSIVRVVLEPGQVGPRPALTLLRAANAVVNAGALVVRCATSGLVHGADSVAALLDRAEAASASDADLADALYESYVLVDAEARRTFGMHALGRPDVALAHDGPRDPERVVITLEDAARAVLRSAGEGYPDPLSKADPRHNPHGLVRA